MADQIPPDDGLDEIARRDALLKIIKTTAYAVPVATVLLASSKDANAGVMVVSGAVA